MEAENPTYVLDTSTVRSMSRRDLDAAVAQGLRLAVSPLTIYEFLCHLDEGDPRRGLVAGAELSPLHRANLSKCRLMTILDDPFAEHAAAAGVAKIVNQTRFDDRAVLPQVLLGLDSAASLEEFYSGRVRYPNQEEGSLRDVSAHARAVLDSAEREYAAHVTRWSRQLIADYTLERLVALPARDFIENALKTTSSLAHSYETDAQTCEDLRGPVFSAAYLHVGYGLVRAIEYLRRAGGQLANLRVDGNDMEDSAICLHINLAQPRVLVTGDGGALNAVSHALLQLRTVSAETDTPVGICCGAIDTGEFRRLASGR